MVSFLKAKIKGNTKGNTYERLMRSFFIAILAAIRRETGVI